MDLGIIRNCTAVGCFFTFLSFFSIEHTDNHVFILGNETHTLKKYILFYVVASVMCGDHYCVGVWFRCGFNSGGYLGVCILHFYECPEHTSTKGEEKASRDILTGWSYIFLGGFLLIFWL